MKTAIRIMGTAAITAVIIIALIACTTRTALRHQQSFTPDIQAELGALQTPQGTDPAIFQQLKDELARQLAQRGKTASTPPTGNANRVGNIHYTDDGGGFYTFYWEYRNSGDYDQNGTVGISDITPLAIHFGHTHTTDGLDRVFDLDNNGVGISDVTPIAQNYGVNCSWYWLQSAPAETGPWMDLGTREFADATGGTADWKEFSYSSNPSITEWFRIVVGDQDQTRGAVTNAFQIGAVFAPVITAVDPLTGASGTTYTPTAINSGDPATSAAWDFGGGATPNTSSDINPSVTLNATGDYNASVTLTNAGGSDTFNYTLTVTPGGGTPPNITDVQPQTGQTGASYSPVATNTGDPATSAAWDFGGGATPNTTTDINPTVTLNATGDYSASVTLTNASGNDTFNYTLSVTPSGGVTWNIHQISSWTGLGSTLSAASVNGMPAVALVDELDRTTIYYFRSTVGNPTGPADWVNMAVDWDPAKSLQGISLAENGVTPLILSYDTNTTSVLYYEALTYTPSTPADWRSPSVVESPASGIGSIFGYPGTMVSYTNGFGLVYAEPTASPPTGPADWIKVQVTSGFGGGDARMKVDLNNDIYINSLDATQDLLISWCPYAGHLNPSSWTTFQASSPTGTQIAWENDLAFDAFNMLFIAYSRLTGSSHIELPVISSGVQPPNNLGFTETLIASSPTASTGGGCSLEVGFDNAYCSYCGGSAFSVLYLGTCRHTSGTPLSSWDALMVDGSSGSTITSTRIIVGSGDATTDDWVGIAYLRADGLYFASAEIP
jgi:PKD repeat protein